MGSLLNFKRKMHVWTRLCRDRAAEQKRESCKVFMHTIYNVWMDAISHKRQIATKADRFIIIITVIKM